MAFIQINHQSGSSRDLCDRDRAELDSEVEALLARSTALMQTDPDTTPTTFSQLTEYVPDFAEGGNKRDTRRQIETINNYIRRNTI